MFGIGACQDSIIMESICLLYDVSCSFMNSVPALQGFPSITSVKTGSTILGSLSGNASLCEFFLFS